MTSELHRALRTRAEECDPAEFKELLLQFGHDPDALKQLTSGLKKQGANEQFNDGDYTCSAGPGYIEWQKKDKMLQDFLLGSGAFKNKPAATKPEKSDDLKELRTQFSELAERVTKLERENIKLKMRPPSV